MMSLGLYLRVCQLPKMFFQFSSMTAQANSEILRKPHLRYISTIADSLASHNEAKFSELPDSNAELSDYSDDSDSELMAAKCPLALDDQKFGFIHDDENNFKRKLRSMCLTLGRRENRRDTVKFFLKDQIEFFADCSEDNHTDRHIKRSGCFIEDDYLNLTNPAYWVSVFRYSKEKNTMQLKRKLSEAKQTELNVSVALAKVYTHLKDCKIKYNDKACGPDDVISVLKTSNLSEKDIEALRIFFNSVEDFEWFCF